MIFELSEVREIVSATFGAFLEQGAYALSYRQACRQFGKTQIDLLIANGLLKNTSDLIGKKKYLISDIITAEAAMAKMSRKNG